MSNLLDRASEFRTKAAEYLAKAEHLEKMDAEVIAAMAEPGTGIPVVATVKDPQNSGVVVKKRGRPAGSKNLTSEKQEKRGPKTNVRLVIRQILNKHPGGISLPDLVKEILQSGYRTKSKGEKKFGNVVYQNLCIMRRDEKIVERNKEDKTWKLAG